MEFIILIIITAVLALVLGISVNLILSSVVFILLIISVLTTILFIITTILLMTGKRQSATFKECIANDRKILFAYYTLSDGSTVKNLFPADSLTNHFLKKNANNEVSISVINLRKQTFCFDKYSITTIFLGLPLFVILSAMLIAILALCF